ncbi:hypothetical protein [Alkalicoccobacillus murimartini]|uniref:Translation initiation factor 2 n=1 Tax=Alkalicoccobacillus murimartini TaxID=171685 RepID=A0ABT9YL27_9BACI|nr:hypothetical protein [Alkalicoccobacillus murimartini]MDQ0208581.1 hypothetical protein [Alkalicoccobacillus murimartini]
MKKSSQPQQSSPEIDDDNLAMSLRLALIGGLITTLGDAISTFAAKTAIEETLQDSATQNMKDSAQEKRLQSMEDQIKLLHKKLDQLF